MTKAAGPQPQLGKDMGFKDHPNVTSLQRRGLNILRKEGEIAALSMDV